jgi:uncharacterized protein involved in exopolysaccharide biosynthesis
VSPPPLLEGVKPVEPEFAPAAQPAAKLPIKANNAVRRVMAAMVRLAHSLTGLLKPASAKEKLSALLVYGDMSDSHRHHQAQASSAQRELDLFDLAAFVWTQKLLALLVAILVFVPLAFLAWSALTPTYEAQSRLLVILDDTDLTPGAAGSGGAFTLDQVMESEAQILNSDAVRRRAIEARRGFARSDQLAAMRQGFSVSRSPNASVLVAAFEDSDADVAANTLNALIDAYLEYRVELLVGVPGSGVEERLEAAEREAARAEAALRAFLNENGLVDFDSERASLVLRVTDLQARQLSAEADAASARSFASSLEQRLGNIPESIELYVENSVSGELLALETRRQALLARYQPSAPPVLAIEREIEALSNFIRDGGAEGRGQRRTGVNPVWQALESERLRQESYAASQAQLARSLGRQLEQARAQADRLRGLAPEHDRLARAVAARAEAAEGLSAQAADASARRNAPPGAADAVRVVERASPPSQASSLRVPAVLAMAVFAFGFGVLVALLRGYLLSRPYRKAGFVSGPQPPHDQGPQQTRGDFVPEAPPPSPRRRRKLPVLAHVGR